MTGSHLFSSRRAFARQLLAVSWSGVALACAAPSQADGSGASKKTADGDAPVQTQQILAIDHVTPRRDFVGPRPDTFVWTAAPGVETYAIGVWSEVDRLMWRDGGITGTSIARPAGLDLEPGTYFWSVSGQQRGHEIARSGQSAFVVE